MIEGHFEKKDKNGHRPLRFREAIGSGSIGEGKEKTKMQWSLNIDGACVFVEFPDLNETVRYDLGDMSQDAYSMVLQKVRT